MDLPRGKIVTQSISHPLPEFIIKTVIPSILAYFSFYVFIEDYMKIDVVKEMLLPTLIPMFLIFLLVSAEDKEKRNILAILLVLSLIYLSYDVVRVIAVLEDLHKNTSRFFLNYLEFIIANLIAIVVLSRIANHLKGYFTSNG